MPDACLIPTPRALSAMAMTLRGDVGVLRGELVPVDALRGPRSPGRPAVAAPDVLGQGNGLQVIRSNAAAVPAQVVDRHAGGNRSGVELVCDAVRVEDLADPSRPSALDLPVSLRVTRPAPLPAVIRSLHLRLPALGQRAGLVIGATRGHVGTIHTNGGLPWRSW